MAVQLSWLSSFLLALGGHSVAASSASSKRTNWNRRRWASCRKRRSCRRTTARSATRSRRCTANTRRCKSLPTARTCRCPPTWSPSTDARDSLLPSAARHSVCHANRGHCRPCCCSLLGGSNLKYTQNLRISSAPPVFLVPAPAKLWRPVRTARSQRWLAKSEPNKFISKRTGLKTRFDSFKTHLIKVTKNEAFLLMYKKRHPRVQRRL